MAKAAFLLSLVMNSTLGWSVHRKNSVVAGWGSYPLGPTPSKRSGQGRRTDVLDYRFDGVFIELAGLLMKYRPDNICIKITESRAEEVHEFWGAMKATLSIAIKQVHPNVDQVEIVGHQQVAKFFTTTKELKNGLRTIPDDQLIEMMKSKTGKSNIDAPSAWAMATGYCARKEIISNG